MARHENGKTSITKRHLSNEYNNFGSVDIGDEKLLFWVTDGEGDHPHCEITSDQGPSDARLWSYSGATDFVDGKRFKLSPSVAKIIQDHPELKVIEIGGLGIDELPGMPPDFPEKILSIFLDKLKSYLKLDYILTSPNFRSRKNQNLEKLVNDLKNGTKQFMEKYSESKELSDIKRLAGVKNNEDI